MRGSAFGLNINMAVIIFGTRPRAYDRITVRWHDLKCDIALNNRYINKKLLLR